MTLDDFSGETIAERGCDLIVRADDEGCFDATDLMAPTITINAYSVDVDAVVITIRPRSTWLGPAIWAYAQVATHATEMRDLGVERDGPTDPLVVLCQVARFASELWPAFTAVTAAN